MRETKNLRFQIGSSSLNGSGYGGRRYMPYVYTEQGISMLASVLRSEIAVNTNIRIMRTFVEMPDTKGRKGNYADRRICGCGNIEFAFQEKRKCVRDNLHAETDKAHKYRCGKF